MGNFLGIFLEDFFGGIIWEVFFMINFWEDYLGGFFLGGIFWEEFFGRNSLFTLLKSPKLFEYGRN